jgi:hypothetical protein
MFTKFAPLSAIFTKHKADEYFKHKLLEAETEEARKLFLEAKAIRHTYPDLSGPELVRLVYWGASGE